MLIKFKQKNDGINCFTFLYWKTGYFVAVAGTPSVEISSFC